MSMTTVEPQRVLVRAAGGVALFRWMVGLGKRVAYITTDAGMEARREGKEAPCVGFPITDIFPENSRIREGDVPEWRELTALALGEKGKGPKP